jgi:flavin-dependent dehydrogenase
MDEQVALVGVVPDVGGERLTTVETVPDGWWYTTPLPHGRRVVAFVTDADLLRGGRSAQWQQALAATHHMSRVVPGDVTPTVGAYPAETGRRAQLSGDGWLAIGDAAVTFDPLSSQGLITAMVMAARAGALLGGEEWESDYRAVLDEHETNRAALYSAETRWPDATFWARRAPVSARTA